MIINGKKYVFSRGVAFYPEKEMEILKKQAQQGWAFQKLNAFGLLKFSKADPENKKFSVDFFSGSKTDISEYLSFYEEAGWECITAYKGKYFYFKADPCTPTIYSDEESYGLRMYKEWMWMFWRNLLCIPIGLVFFWLNVKLGQWDIPHNSLFFSTRMLLLFVGTFLTAMPLSIIINVIFSLVIYKDRRKFYDRPEQFAKKQRYVRDLTILMVIGAVIGALMAFTGLVDF
ncbi:DUF2812 domain-containing protein [Enterococcus larvae]|uniref:DUF2812 domain-containing protein n=1 Tax=Enterococcus larvae TaxID=2794352 RepID=UPI003F356077